MTRNILASCCAIAIATFAVALSPLASAQATPGKRTVMMAHNAYPFDGQYADRLDRAVAAGVPFAVEEDMVWLDNRSLIVRNKKADPATAPTLQSYFFPKVAPLMEQAMKSGDKKNWPLVILYLDIKKSGPEHMEQIVKDLAPYSDWMTSAVKTDDIHHQSPLDVKPMMVIVEDKEGDNARQSVFYDKVPLGGKITIFGSNDRQMDNPQHLSEDAEFARQAALTPESLITRPADNYHRWWGIGWMYIEQGNASKAGEWTPQDAKRLHDFVSKAHQSGYLVGVTCLDGFTADQNQGWEDQYSFGSLDAAKLRWKAAIHEKVDFITTDQYQEAADYIRANRK